MAERRGTKALELWCRRMTEGYPGVKVENMTTSWRDGLAFCAMIHHFRPDLIDFASLNKNDVYRNNELAFRIAESHLGIPALLDAEDMVEYSVPDRLSILTYLSQFYQAFGGSQGGSPTRLMSKRASTTPPDHGMVSPGSAGPPTKIAAKGGVGAGVLRREPCSRCGLPVFLAERLLVGRRLYHRTCFRCARCSHQLSLANYYETEDGQYCCETCPDEEEDVQITKAHSENEVDSCLEKQKVLTRSLSDEEKQKGLLRYEDSSDVSPMSKAMSDFMNSNMLEPDRTDGRESPPVESELSPIVEAVNACVECVEERGEEQCVNKHVELPFPNVSESESERRVNNEQINYKCSDSDVPSICSLSSDDKANAVTKETNAAANKDDLPNPRLSLVKMRMQMFEKDASSQQEQNVESSVRLSSNQLDTDKLCESQIPKVPSLDKLDNTNEPEQLKTKFNKTDDIGLDSVQKSDAEISLVTDETKLDKSIEENENLSVKVETLSPVTNSVVENDESDVYPEELNPFGDDDDGHDIKLVKKESTNPFGSSDEDEEEMKPPVPSPRTKKTVEAPKICLNPFWSDGEEPSDDDVKTTMPVPKPRMTIISSTPAKSESNLKSAVGQPLCKIGTPYDSTVSLNSSGQRTPCGTVRKKKPAPPPPSVAKELFAADDSSLHSSISSSPSHSRSHSPKVTPKLRKNRPAPAPPDFTASATDSIVTPAELKDKLVVVSDEQITDKSLGSSEWEKAKTSKDEQNRTRQSMISSTNSTISPTSDNDMPSFPTMNKSMYGKWKRKKGPAPPRPAPPQRRQIRALPMIEDLKRELELIEVQQQGLEKQGVKIEQLIREKCEGPNSSDDSSMTPEVEDLVLQLFELVNEKNELFRKQAELMYLRRQQRLEEEHADLEYQIRCLMAQPEKNKTDSDKAREEELISRLVEVVERRNEIVECLEMDRLREAEEDLSISSHLTLLAAKRDEESNLQSQSPVKVSKKEKRKIKKEKRARAKGNNMDADKDVDESESTISVSPIKDKKKKKWFLKI